MKIGIVTDSTCDIPGFLVEQHELEVVPCILAMDGKEYIDGRDITREEFYRQLPALNTQPRRRSAISRPGMILSSRAAAIIFCPFTRLAR